mgnify:CR=1 FL=1
MANELPPVLQWPSARHLGATILGYDEETHTVEMAFTPPPEFATMRGQVQGGLLAGPLDEAFGAAVFLASGGKLQLTLDINLSLLRPVSMNPITVKARAVKSGKCITFVEGELFDHEGKLCARATATSMTTDWPGQSKVEGDG